jgi:hypothetical protein
MCRTNERGNATLEFAMAFPLLLILVISAMDFGVCLYSGHTLQYATREGAYTALVAQKPADASGHAATSAATIIKTIQDDASIAIPASRLSISIYPVQPDMSDPVGWEGKQNAGVGGQYIRVRTSYDYHFLTPVLANVFKGGVMTLKAQSTYRNDAQ